MPGAGGGQPASRRALRELVVGVQRRVLPLAATELEVELFESVLELVVEELLGLEPPLELLFDRPGAGGGAEDGSGDDEEAGAICRRREDEHRRRATPLLVHSSRLQKFVQAVSSGKLFTFDGPALTMELCDG